MGDMVEAEAKGERVRAILAAVKPLAAEYYQLTSKPLGVSEFKRMAVKVWPA